MLFNGKRIADLEKRIEDLEGLMSDLGDGLDDCVQQLDFDRLEGDMSELELRMTEPETTSSITGLTPMTEPETTSDHDQITDKVVRLQGGDNVGRLESELTRLRERLASVEAYRASGIELLEDERATTARLREELDFVEADNGRLTREYLRLRRIEKAARGILEYTQPELDSPKWAAFRNAFN